MKSELSEKDIERQILEFLETLPDCFAWKQNTVGAPSGSGGYRLAKSRFIFRGVSDILGVFRGRAIAIEVKTRVGKVSPEQEMFMENIRNHGGFAFVARSLDDAIRKMKEISDEL